MRNPRRLPPFLGMLRFVAVLLLIAGSGLCVLEIAKVLLGYPQWPPDASQPLHTVVIAANLGLVGWACASVVTTYRLRFRQPQSGPFPLSSWQSQVRMLALLAALPTSALVLALILPLASPTFFVVAGMTPLALFVLRLADVLTARRATNNSALRTPRAP